MPGWGNPHQVGKVLEYKVYPEWSLSLPVFQSANSSLDENLRYFVVLVIPFFIFFLNPLFRTCIEIKGWQAYIGRVFSYLPKLPNPRKYPTTSLPARGGWHHSVFVLVVLPSNRSTFSVAQLRVFTDELNVSLGIFGVRQQVNGINVGNSVRCCEIFVWVGDWIFPDVRVIEIKERLCS